MNTNPLTYKNNYHIFILFLYLTLCPFVSFHESILNCFFFFLMHRIALKLVKNRSNLCWSAASDKTDSRHSKETRLRPWTNWIRPAPLQTCETSTCEDSHQPKQSFFVLFLVLYFQNNLYLLPPRKKIFKNYFKYKKKEKKLNY